MDNNNIFTNGGSNGEIDYHLPKLGTNYYDLGYDGMKLTFIRRNGYSMKIYPDSTQIIGSASGVGKYLELQGSLSSVTIMAVTGGTWVVLSSNGTIGYEP
jgi:hypothetical protein